MPRGRRGHGLGSVYKRADGRFVVHVSLGVDADGQRQYHREYLPKGTKKREADAALVQALEKLGRRQLVASSRQTVAAYLAYWLETSWPGWREKWAVEVKRYVEQVITPAIGGHRLDQLTPAICQGFIATLQRTRSPRYVQLVRGIVRHALADAVRWQVLPSNPMDATSSPRVPKREYTVWTDAQLHTFLDAIVGSYDAQLYVVAILTGARAGELLALTWSDVDLPRGTVTIIRSVTRVPGKGLVLTEPKSRASRRTISINADAVEALRRQRVANAERQLRLGEHWHDDNLVFPGQMGQIRGIEAARQHLHRFCAQLGLPDIRFHDLRHLSATLMLDSGESFKVVQQRLGHSSSSVTLDVYGHVLDGADRAASDRLGQRVRVPKREDDNLWAAVWQENATQSGTTERPMKKKAETK